MPEVPIGFPRAFAEFADPADPDQVFRCDLTWLTSRWTCIFGQGCPGIYADRPDDGCCTLGAHFADADDERRVGKAVRQLTPAQWQYRAGGPPARLGRVRGPARVGAGREAGPQDPDRRRRLHLPQPARVRRRHRLRAAPAGPATRAASCRETKPDVCWQLPIRRQYRTVTRTDETTYTEVTIGEYGRDGWGPGGADLDWYCTANTEAHHGRQPVYLSSAAELTALMGPAGVRRAGRALCRVRVPKRAAAAAPRGPPGAASLRFS